MSTTEIVQIVATVSIPIVTAILGVLGIVFHDWRARRTQAGRRKLAFEQASRQVSFAAEWWNARRLLAESPEAMQEATSRTLAWLEEASALAMESRPPPSDDERPPITVRRLLLLSDPFHRRSAKIIRAVFYASLGYLLISVSLVISAILNGSERPYLVDYMAGMVTVALLALGFRFSAGFVNNQGTEPRKGRRATIRRSLLFYRLHGPAANIVRIIFYVWIALAAAMASTLPGDLSETPNDLPIDVALLIVSIGYAAVFRHWAASLGAKREASATRSSQASLHEPEPRR